MVETMIIQNTLVFIQLYRLLAFSSLIRPPKGNNVNISETIKSLIELKTETDLAEEKIARRVDLELRLDAAIENGFAVEFENEKMFSDVVQYFAGYEARKYSLFTFYGMSNVHKRIKCIPRLNISIQEIRKFNFKT